MFAIDTVMGDCGTPACTHGTANARADKGRLVLGHPSAAGHEET
jgi:hypothetical protein